ncbi:hypothetical protein NBRC10513_000405 [Rhodotorula toruloides]|uniref:glutathione peroxidase n=2 Tax=Rhodotorula toruloides TaxID=5286 RepID=A0A0K3CGM9_RHOTO
MLTRRTRLLTVLAVVSLLPIVALIQTYRHLAHRSSTSLSLADSSLSLLHTTPPPAEAAQPPQTNTMSAREAVEQKIAQGKRTVVFSKSYCPYCRRAKQILKDAGEDFDVYELDQMDEGSEWQNALASKTGQRTVPSIWIGGNFIGGCSDLEAKQRSGELKTLLGGKAQ